MAFVDVLMLFFVLLFTVLGFFKGMVKIAIAIATFYLAIVLSSLYFGFLARKLGTNSTTPLPILEMLSFLILLVVFYVVLLFTGLYMFKYVRFGGRTQIIDGMVGAALGLFLGAMFASVLAMMLRYLFERQMTQATLDFPAMRFLAESTNNSILKDLFLNGVLPVLYTPLRPILPDSADRIFRSLQN